MKQTFIQKCVFVIKKAPLSIKWYFKKNKCESVYFFTFHKCASSLFSNYVLRNVNGLILKDYAKIIYKRGDHNIRFNKTGYIYGPLRLSANTKSPVYKKLIAPVSKSDFLSNKKAIFFIRDPRDILVSAYYSFGYTHGLSHVKQIRELQESKKSAILNQSIDEYVLNSVEEISKNFKLLNSLLDKCNKSVVLKYEDMITNFDSFINSFREIVDINEDIVQDIYKKSRPRKKEEKTSHRRSGHPGGYKNKLKKETIITLNEILHEVLIMFNYDQ